MSSHKKPRLVEPVRVQPVDRLKEIRFYRADETPYGAFSNLYRRPILFEGRRYQTAEHAYQSGKPKKEAVREWILSAPTPALVAMAAHGLYTWEVVSNWSTIKTERMRAVLRAKFTQHSDLGELLLSTENTRLVEAGRVNNAINRFWGKVNGKGHNMLGLLLMDIREELRSKIQPNRTISLPRHERKDDRSRNPGAKHDSHMKKHCL